MLLRPGLLLLRDVAAMLTEAGAPKPWRALSLSYQDVVVADEDLVEVLGEDRFARLHYRPDAPEIVRWHKCEAITTKIPDWHDLLRLLGFDPLSTDLLPARGCEQFLDLNVPLPAEHVLRYRLVLDNVAQHCFDPATALRNVAAACDVGGFALHVTPLVMINQGFYCFGPTLFHDFYAANGFAIIRHDWFPLVRDVSPRRTYPVDPTRRMKDISTDSVQLVLARRNTLATPSVVPTQTKFVRHPDSRVAEGEVR